MRKVGAKSENRKQVSKECVPVGPQKLYTFQTPGWVGEFRSKNNAVPLHLDDLPDSWQKRPDDYSLLGVFNSNQSCLEFSHVLRGLYQNLRPFHTEEKVSNEHTRTHEVVTAFRIDDVEDTNLCQEPPTFMKSISNGDSLSEEQPKKNFNFNRDFQFLDILTHWVP